MIAGMREADIGRTWLYRASVGGRTVAQERHASDVVAGQWALQVVWPSLVPKPTEGAMLVEREDGSGAWQPVVELLRDGDEP